MAASDLVTELCHEDREWFARHPRALVRFRPSRDHENDALSATGLSRPTFVPTGLHASELPTWVAVVELSRALGLPDVSDGVSVRIRVYTVPIRSRKLKMQLAPMFVRAVVDDFLAQGSEAFASDAA